MVNLVTDIDFALEAFAEMEGEDYVLRQLEFVDNPERRTAFSLAGAIFWLREKATPGGCSFEIYTQGGYRRYFVRPDGEVVFSNHHDSFHKDEADAAGFGLLYY
jgi:hypothetical protein